MCGCNYAEVGLVQNSDGTIIEYYYIPFPERELEQNGVSLQTTRTRILSSIKAECDEIFTDFINDYQSRVSNSQKYTIEEKTILIEGVTFTSTLPQGYTNLLNYYSGIRYEVHFKNSICYQEFKNANDIIKEEKIVETTSNLFTTTTKIVKDPIFDKIASDSIALGQKCVNAANRIMEECLGAALWGRLKSDLNYAEYASKFTYTYIVPTARVHTNADSVQKSTEGYYYHTWEINVDNIGENGESIVQIQYWTVSANRWVWYLTALIIASGITVAAILIGRHKEKKIVQNFKGPCDLR